MKFRQYLSKLNRSQLIHIAEKCLSELELTDAIKFFPNREDMPSHPYWEASGEPVLKEGIKENFVLKEYRAWRESHPDEDYRADEMDDFLGDTTRGDIFGLLEDLTD